MKSLSYLMAGVLLSLSTIATAGPTVYGKANVSLQKIDQEGSSSDNWQLESNASRIGFAGTEKLTEGLSAVYKLEYEVAIDDGDADGDGNEFKQRNIYAGLQSAWGTLIAGKFDTPLKTSQGKVDQFGDLKYGDIKNVMAGENRVSNIIQYSSPKIADIARVNIAVVAGEEEGSDSDDDSAADYRSVSVQFGDAAYKSQPFYAAIAYDDEVTSKLDANVAKGALDALAGSSKVAMDLIRLSGGMRIGNTKVAAIYQTGESSDNVQTGTTVDGELEQDAYGVSVAHAIDKLVLKAQYMTSENTLDDTAGADAIDVDVEQIAVGADYKLSKKSKLFAYYSQIDSEDNVADTENKDKTFGAGLEVKF